jgi:hypothetical protein
MLKEADIFEKLQATIAFGMLGCRRAEILYISTRHLGHLFGDFSESNFLFSLSLFVKLFIGQI